MNAQVQSVKLLLAAGARADLKDNDGCTALQVCRCAGVGCGVRVGGRVKGAWCGVRVWGELVGAGCWVLRQVRGRDCHTCQQHCTCAPMHTSRSFHNVHSCTTRILTHSPACRFHPEIQALIHGAHFSNVRPGVRAARDINPHTGQPMQPCAFRFVLLPAFLDPKRGRTVSLRELA